AAAAVADGAIVDEVERPVGAEDRRDRPVDRTQACRKGLLAADVSAAEVVGVLLARRAAVRQMRLVGDRAVEGEPTEGDLERLTRPAEVDETDVVHRLPLPAAGREAEIALPGNQGRPVLDHPVREAGGSKV